MLLKPVIHQPYFFLNYFASRRMFFLCSSVIKLVTPGISKKLKNKLWGQLLKEARLEERII